MPFYTVSEEVKFYQENAENQRQAGKNVVGEAQPAAASPLSKLQSHKPGNRVHAHHQRPCWLPDKKLYIRLLELLQDQVQMGGELKKSFF